MVIAPVSIDELRPAGPIVEEEPRFDFEADGTNRERVGGQPRRRPGAGGTERPARPRYTPTEETVTGGVTDEGRVITITTEVP